MIFADGEWRLIEAVKAISKKGSRKSRFVLPIILGFMSYQFILCFINTNIFEVTNFLVALTECILLMLLMWRIFPSCRPSEKVFVYFLMMYFFALWVLRGEADPSGPRDILLILMAFALGRANPDREVANKIVWIVSSLVLVVAGIEYFFTDAYLRVFNILQYYIARGEVSASDVGWVKQNSFVSGFRPGGRNMMSFLGDIRVSSIFLEPVSMGNYAIILCIWALSFDFKDRRKVMGHLTVAFILIVASDSRFASILVFFLFIMRFIPIFQKRLVVYFLPFLVVASLLAFTLLGLGDATQDNLSGRLMRSGAAMTDMNFAQLLGIGIPDSLGDMGVAYSIEHFGVLLCIALWPVFAFPSLQNKRASRFRLMLAIYGLGILLISGSSLYSAKTAVIVWFLYGVLYRTPKSEFDGYRSKRLREKFNFITHYMQIL